MKRYALIAILASAGALSAQPACSNASIRGTYGLDGSGAIYQPPGPPLPVAGPFVRVGAVHFDGAGTVRYDTFSSYNGFVTAEPYVGAYTVGPDCKYTYSAFLPPPISLPTTFSGYVSANGDHVDYMLVSPDGAGVHATLTRQPMARCQTRDLVGTYSLGSHGTLLPPYPINGPFVRTGTLTNTIDPAGIPYGSNPTGRFTLTAMTNYSGGNVQETLSGTFSVQADCKVSFDYDQPTPFGNLPSRMRGFLVNGNKKVVFMNTLQGDILPQGLVVRGWMTRQ